MNYQELLQKKLGTSRNTQDGDAILWLMNRVEELETELRSQN